jgi:hypothetical protein
MPAIGGPFIGHAAGAAVGEGVQRLNRAAIEARQLRQTKELFLGKSDKGTLNKNYERAAAVLAHAATPALTH